MQFSRLMMLVATVAVAIPTAPATPSGARATILNEVQNHLNQAQKCFDNGTYHLAVAHASMVLVDETLTYAVLFQNVPIGIQPDAKKALDQGLRTWERSLDGTVKFQKIDNADEADIVIRFKPDVRMGREPVAGFANWKRIITTDADGKVSSRFTSDLQIRTMTLNWKAMPVAAMKHEIMHEVGHVLGLEDCENSGDIMGPLDMARPVDAPRPHETRAVFELRAQASKIRREAAAQTLKQ